MPILTLLLAATVYAKLDYVSDVPQPHPSGKPPARTLIVVDPGHGGEDSGAISCDRRPEKDANLLAATDLAVALTNRGYRVVMTRDEDRTLALYERPAVGVLYDADAFVSIHHNAPSPGKDPRVTRYRSVYSWNPLGAALARAIAREMCCSAYPANYAVTRNPQIPSCLVEIDFITHPEGAKAAWDAAERRRIVGRIADGIDHWVRNPR